MAASCRAVLETFRRFDEKGNGTISREELARVLRGLDPRWADENIISLFAGADTDSDGRIQLRSFLAWIFGDAAADSAFDEVSPYTAEPLPQAPRGDEVDRAIAAAEEQEMVPLQSLVASLEEPHEGVEEPELVILESSISGIYGEVSSLRSAGNAVQALIDAPGIRAACEQQLASFSGASQRCELAVWRALSYTTSAHHRAGTDTGTKYTVTVATSQAGVQADGSYEQEIMEIELLVSANSSSTASRPQFLGAGSPMVVLEDAQPSANIEVNIEENYMDRGT